MKINILICKIMNRLFRKPTVCGRQSREDYAKWEFDIAPSNLESFKPYSSFDAKIILDLGCGMGGKSLYYAMNGAKEVFALDTDLDRVKIGIKTAKLKNIDNLHFVTADAGKLPFKSNSFDLVMMNDCIEHLFNLEESLSECYRILKDGGMILANWMSYRSPFGAHLYDYVYAPWCHLVFSERALVKIWKEEFSKEYERGKNLSEQFSPADICNTMTIRELQHLNKITVKEFGKTVQKTKFSMLKCDLITTYPFKDLPFFGKFGYEFQMFAKQLPLDLREYFAGSIITVLKK